MIALSEAMSQDPDLDINGRCRLFVKLQILMLLPNLYNFLKSFRVGAFRKDLHMPTWRQVILGVLISVLESSGLCLFVFSIPGICKAHHIVLLMNCVFIVPAFDNIIQSCRAKTDRLKTKILFGVVWVLTLVGVCLSFSLVYFHLTLADFWKPITGVLLLSLAWTPTVHRYLVKRQNNEVNEGIRTDDIEEGEVTWKLTIILSAVKLFSTFGLSMILFSVDELSPFPSNISVSLSNYTNGWRFSVWEESSQKEVYYFVGHICSSFVSYYVGYLACTTCMQFWAFAFPLSSTIIPNLLVLTIKISCESLLMRVGSTEGVLNCVVVPKSRKMDLVLLIIAGICLFTGQMIFTFSLLWKNRTLMKLKEKQLFWLPVYTSALLDQWLMLTLRNEGNDTVYAEREQRGRKSKVIICTTMYRETEHEMRQLLESLKGVLETKQEHHYESHIVFDCGAKGNDLTEYALQLLYLIEDIFGQYKKDDNSNEVPLMETPYGMKLKRTFKSSMTYMIENTEKQAEMDITIHFKNDSKVKSKKRWSQVMYMSYILDYRLNELKENKGENDENTLEKMFILTTDADVQFTSDSIAYLLDLMVRDENVGAVCARTFPLGNGPIVWYQAFEYAIGHWFQKAAEHVLGSVLCSPGCFSVYRCKAIKEVLKTYSSDVDDAFDFLIKDMGEDRWLCTLLVQSGLRIEYCAASENSTHCHETFDEYFKQRRRWVVSTLANMMLLLRQWNFVSFSNHRVTFLFGIYQAFLLFASLIGPSSVMLIICGSLNYAWNWNPITTFILQLAICIGFTTICLVAPSKTQLRVAKILTFIYAVIMTAVLVGTAVQVSNDVRKVPGSEANFISDDITLSTTTVYLTGITGMFVICAIVHLKECVYLLHGIWYLLFLPTGYLLLIIYSICNITDRSWGTRDPRQVSDSGFYENIRKHLSELYCVMCNRCCKRNDQEEDKTDPENTSVRVLDDTHASQHTQSISENLCCKRNDQEEDRTDPENTSVKVLDDTHASQSIRENLYGDDQVQVDSWLSMISMKKYKDIFIKNGYESVGFISSMTHQDLRKIGVEEVDQLTIMAKIRKERTYYISPSIPWDIHIWLTDIGLSKYKENFKKASIVSSESLETLKTLRKSDIRQKLGIVKRGHIQRLLYAIEQLRQPTQREIKIKSVRENLPIITEESKDDWSFWETLIKHCLRPQSDAFGSDKDLKRKLTELRNSWLAVFALSNILWLILVFTLAAQGELLSVFGSNPIGFAIVLLFSFILIIQFLAMLCHRFSTFKHYLARAPYLWSSGANMVYSFGKSSSDENSNQQHRGSSSDENSNQQPCVSIIELPGPDLSYRRQTIQDEGENNKNSTDI